MRFDTTAVLVCTLVAIPLRGQEVRDSLLQASIDASGFARSELLFQALDPAHGPPDDAWLGAGLELARVVVEDGAARTDYWLRWLAREWPGPGRPGLAAEVPIRLAGAFSQAWGIVQAQRSEMDSFVSSEWSWPSVLDPARPGTLIVKTDRTDAGVVVDGAPEVATGQPLSLEPGTYRIEVRGKGLDAVVSHAEVLPGTIRTLTVRVGEATSTNWRVHRGEIESRLRSAAAAWSRGNLEGYLAIFHESVTFLTSDGVWSGRSAVEAQLRSSVPAGDANEELRFDNVLVRRLDSGAALATARFVRTGTGGLDQVGWLTSVWVQTEGGWKVIHDHSRW